MSENINSLAHQISFLKIGKLTPLSPRETIQHNWLKLKLKQIQYHSVTIENFGRKKITEKLTQQNFTLKIFSNVAKWPNLSMVNYREAQKK